MAWSPLDKGRLGAGDPSPSGHPDADARQRLREALEVLSAATGFSRAVLAIAWLLKLPGVVPVVGSTQPDRIRDLARATEVSLDRDTWYRLLEAAGGARLP